MLARWQIPIVVPAALLLAASLAACGESVDLGGPGDGGVCLACTADPQCGANAVCGDFGSESLCVSLCPSDTECGADTACVTLGSVTGAQVSACAPRPNVCAATGLADAAPPPESGTCGVLVGPAVHATCSACREDKRPCQTNGCYNGWWCNTVTIRCVAPPLACSTPLVDAGPG